MTATAAEATQVKNKTANWLHNEITRRLERILGIADPINTHSVQFQLKTAWPETKTQKNQNYGDHDPQCGLHPYSRLS